MEGGVERGEKEEGERERQGGKESEREKEAGRERESRGKKEKNDWLSQHMAHVDNW